jgi:hypothetical protein
MNHEEPGNKNKYDKFEINKIYPGEAAVKPALALGLSKKPL